VTFAAKVLSLSEVGARVFGVGARILTARGARSPGAPLTCWRRGAAREARSPGPRETSVRILLLLFLLVKELHDEMLDIAGVWFRGLQEIQAIAFTARAETPFSREVPYRGPDGRNDPESPRNPGRGTCQWC